MKVDDVLFARACRDLAAIVREDAAEMGFAGKPADATIAHLGFMAGLELAERDPVRAEIYRTRLRELAASERGTVDLVRVFREAVR